MPSSEEIREIQLLEVEASRTSANLETSAIDRMEGECQTEGGAAGADVGTKCTFPFTFLGKTYNGCTTVLSTRLWCSTKTDADGNHILGEDTWGYCNEECPEHRK